MKPERRLDEVYPEQTQRWMKAFYEQLSERDQRLYAAVEGQKLGHGGIKVVCELFGCGRGPVRRGMRELGEPARLPEDGRVRHPGGGRKGVVYEHEALETTVEGILAHTIAGDPMNAQVKWTHLSARQIREQLAAQGIEIAENTVRALLKKRLRETQSAKALCHGPV